MSVIRADMSRAEAVQIWRQALIQASWFDTCGTEEVKVEEALGRTTVRPVVAIRPVPHYAGSAMDGFAVRSADTRDASRDNPVILRILHSGDAPAAGTAFRVDTGDALPTGADSIIMTEYAEEKDETLEIFSPVLPGQHVRKIGEDIIAGSQFLPAGRVISPSDMAAVLAAGEDKIHVVARPRITVIPTGDEIVDSVDKLAPGHIRDINSHMLSALFSSWGAKVRRHAVVPDDPVLLREAVAGSLEQSDLVVTNAGTANGTQDFTEQVLSQLGQVYCHGVTIRPGRPVILAAVNGKPVIGLPGYPVSCMLTADLFLRDLIYEYRKQSPPERLTMKAKLDKEVRSKLDVEEFVRVALTPGASCAVATVLARGASLISSLTQADGMIRIPINIEKIEAGEIVEVEVFPKY